MKKRTNQRGGDRRSGKTYGPNNIVYSNRCQHCHLSFECSRPDALYCSDAHRSAAARLRKIDAALTASIKALDECSKRKQKRKRNPTAR